MVLALEKWIDQTEKKTIYIPELALVLLIWSLKYSLGFLCLFVHKLVTKTECFEGEDSTHSINEKVTGMSLGM